MASDEVQLSEPISDRERPGKKQWSDLSPNQRAAIVVGAIVELVLTTIALRDLARRRPDAVRGWKPLWALTFVVQPFGPILYLLFGRRKLSG
jgi:hypothetical protein